VPDGADQPFNSQKKWVRFAKLAATSAATTNLELGSFCKKMDSNSLTLHYARDTFRPFRCC